MINPFLLQSYQSVVVKMAPEYLDQRLHCTMVFRTKNQGLILPPSPQKSQWSRECAFNLFIYLTTFGANASAPLRNDMGRN